MMGLSWQQARIPTGLLFFLVLLAIMGSRNFAPTLEETIPIIAGLAIGMCLQVLWSLRNLPGYITQYNFTWWYSLQHTGWPIFVVAILCLIAVELMQPNLPVDSIALILPILAGLQGAFLLSPDDEPLLETLLTLERPLAWSLIERFIVLMTGMLLIAIYMGLVLGDAMAMFAWIVPAQFCGGLGCYITLRSRVAAFGAVVVTLIWGASVYLRDFVVPRIAYPLPLNYVHPFLWGFAPYLPSDLEGPVWLNTLLVTATGLQLLIASALLLADEEQTLLGEKSS